MTAKKYAISPKSADTALCYGKTVSKGILGMAEMIEKQAAEIAQMGAWIEERV